MTTTAKARHTTNQTDGTKEIWRNKEQTSDPWPLMPRSESAQPGRVCWCSFRIRNSCVRGCHRSCSTEIRLRIQRKRTKARQTRSQARSSSPVQKSETQSDWRKQLSHDHYNHNLRLHPIHRSLVPPPPLVDPSLALPCPSRQLQRQVLQIASIHHVHLEQPQQEWRLCGRQEC